MLGLNVAREFPGLEMLRHQSCLFSSGFLLYSCDFFGDFASERQEAASPGGAEGRSGAQGLLTGKISLVREIK